MKLMLYILAGAAALELVALLLPSTVRKYGAILSLLATSFASGGVLTAHFSVAAALIFLISIYRVVNLLRVVQARVNESYLRKSGRQASVWLIGGQLIVFSVWYGVMKFPASDRKLFTFLAALQLLTAFMLVLSLVRHLRTTKFRNVTANFADRDLPTVTVAIPARNEDEQLEECLQSVLASDYPKLEVIVLDDCSQDNTPAIIRGFAHDGVRFVPGEQPEQSWLAKNQAYDRLAKEASGELILFCGVDVRFGPSTLRGLVATLIDKDKKMLSVMPLNEQQSPSMAQVARYMWELALPRRMFNRPPVLSSCWMISGESLKKLGGFAAVSRSIVPEAYFARELTKTDGYSFLRANEHLGLISVKNSKDQQATAVRTRYPQLHRRLELVLASSVVEFSLLLLPFVFVIVGLWGALGLSVEVMSVATVLMLALIYRLLEYVAFPRNRWLALLMFPFAIFYDLVLLQYSMWKYEFSEVVWKGRNVCVPAMRVISHLPKV